MWSGWIGWSGVVSREGFADGTCSVYSRNDRGTYHGLMMQRSAANLGMLVFFCSPDDGGKVAQTVQVTQSQGLLDQLSVACGCIVLDL